MSIAEVLVIPAMLTTTVVAHGSLETIALTVFLQVILPGLNTRPRDGKGRDKGVSYFDGTGRNEKGVFIF